jgi:hypothetical protein
MNMTIYLCGPIAGRTDAECVYWRDLVTVLWPGPTLNPLRRDYRGRELENPAKLVQDDLDDINNSAGLVVWFDAPSVGTSMEIFYAHHVRGLPIVVVDRRRDRSHPLSPWLVQHTDVIVDDINVALTNLRSLIANNKDILQCERTQ